MNGDAFTLTQIFFWAQHMKSLPVSDNQQIDIFRCWVFFVLNVECMMAEVFDSSNVQSMIRFA